MTPGGQVDVAAVRARHRIEDVIANAGVELRPAARGYLGCCPFHDDTTASMSVGGVPDRFHCFGCGATGDVIDFIQRLHHVGFRHAVDLLENAAPTRVRVARPRSVAPVSTVPAIVPARAFEINALAWALYTRPVAHQTAVNYLARRRGIDLTAAETHAARPLAGYAGSGWTTLVDHLRAHGVTDAEMVALDLAHPSRRGTLIDTLRDRLILPVTGPQGRIAGFVGRDTSGHRAAPKYRNPTHTAAFDKSTALYTPVPISHRGATVVVVEGPLDALAITATAAGAGRVGELVPVSTLGTAVSEAQAQTVVALTAGPIVLALDADQAGRQGTIRWVDRVCRELGRPALVTDLTSGTDPASLLADHGPQALAAFTPTHDRDTAGIGWPAPRQPGHELVRAALAAHPRRPVTGVLDALTPLVQALDRDNAQALLRAAEAEMTRQGWNPQDVFTHALTYTFGPAGHTRAHEPTAAPTRDLL